MISGLRSGVRMTETVMIVANNKLATPTPIRAGFAEEWSAVRCPEYQNQHTNPDDDR